VDSAKSSDRYSKDPRVAEMEAAADIMNAIKTACLAISYVIGKKRLGRGGSPNGEKAKGIAVHLHRRLISDHEAMRSLVLSLHNAAEAGLTDEMDAEGEPDAEYGPIFQCEATEDGTQWWFVCPKCGKTNTHGSETGHRLSHCLGDCWPKGYYLRGPK